MKPILSKRRNPKPIKEDSNLVTKLELGVRYFMETGTDMIPVTILQYGNPEYRQSLGNNYFEGSLQEIFEQEDSIPLDEFYLTLALNDKRLYKDVNNKPLNPILKPVEERKVISEGIYQEIDRSYASNPKSVYFKYLKTLKRLDIKPTKEHLEYICKKMTYASGWSYYKCKELGI